MLILFLWPSFPSLSFFFPSRSKFFKLSIFYVFHAILLVLKDKRNCIEILLTEPNPEYILLCTVESLRKVQSDTNSFLTELIASRGELNGAAANDNTAISDDDDNDDDNSDDDDSMTKEPLEKIAKVI